MRIVRHPNIVQLKAFYYSNGERVCIIIALSESIVADEESRRMRSISIWSRNSFLRPSIGHLVFSIK